MNDLVHTIENCKLLNYADDTKIYLSHSVPQIVEGGINRDQEIIKVREWISHIGPLPIR